MNFAVLFKPYQLIEKLAQRIGKARRLKTLQQTPGRWLKHPHIDSLEFLQIIGNDVAVASPVIFDIGSNVGTWTTLAKSVIPLATIHAFEPLPEHILAFQKNCSALTDVHLHQYCVGAENTTGVINVSSYSDASSILEATSLEYEHFGIKKLKEEQVDIKRLDNLIQTKKLPCPNVIKLDIQGFELEALKGMADYLNSLQYVICEVSFKPYYQNQPLFLDIANYLARYNLQILAFSHNTPTGSELNQIDVLFKQATGAAKIKA
jgi:FkbM family methyltransferase